MNVFEIQFYGLVWHGIRIQYQKFVKFDKLWFVMQGLYILIINKDSKQHSYIECPGSLVGSVLDY